jgi:hypothetical protein
MGKWLEPGPEQEAEKMDRLRNTDLEVCLATCLVSHCMINPSSAADQKRPGVSNATANLFTCPKVLNQGSLR